MSKTRILVADDNADTCRYIVQHLRMETDLDTEVDVAYDRDAALDRIQTARVPFDIVIADLWMPDSQKVRDEFSGLKILNASREQTPPAEVIIITGNSSADTALRASLTGAREYILKPIDYEFLLRVVRQVIIERALPPKEDFDAEPWEQSVSTPIVGASPAMIEVMKALGRISPTDADVLIEGESGVGKELVARTIHTNSPRAKGRFVAVNCSAIPDNLIEAELFGIGKRVATEVDARSGKFMEANGGTLFLDEIGETSLDVQPKLLRAIEYKEIQRVGGETLHADVRIVAASNRRLEEAVQAGTFRKDLYYRLSGVVLRVPPIRERKDDVPLLAEFFLRKHASRLRKRIFGYETDVLAFLKNRSWPGNVRELENAVETAVLKCSGVLIRTEDFPHESKSAATETYAPDGSSPPLSVFLEEMANLPLDEATAEFERRFISHVLEQTGANVTQAAKRLRMSRTALHRKMSQLGIRRSGDEPA